MRPLFHPFLVNGAAGDPCVYVEVLFERRALMFDVGEISPLSGRKLLRISDIFISHTHMDHFIGLDHLVRVCLGRQTGVRLFGPPGLIGQVEHKLQAYTWNLVENYTADFTVSVTEIDEAYGARSARFRCRTGFAREREQPFEVRNGVLLKEALFTVRCAVLDHRIPCLAYCLDEHRHVNIWKNRLAEQGLALGRWLRELKQAVLRGDRDDTPIPVAWRDGAGAGPAHLPLGELKAGILRIEPGQKIGYVVDAVYHEDNARRIVQLVEGADLLFIETPFLDADADQAAAKFHLTARQAGMLARRARVKRIVPMHYSARYGHDTDGLARESQEAFVRGQ